MCIDRLGCSCSGSAFPATLAIKVRELAPQGFKLDSVATVIDCVNFNGYEDSSPTAKVRNVGLPGPTNFSKILQLSTDPSKVHRLPVIEQIRSGL
jgi:G3E family GTPase